MGQREKILMFNTKLSDANCNTKCETVCSLNSCGVLHIVVTRKCVLSVSRTVCRPVAERRCTRTHTERVDGEPDSPAENRIGLTDKRLC